MEQKTAQEFIGLQSHAASLVAMGVVSPTEGDLAFGHGQKPGVGDGDAVGIAGKVGEDLGGSGKGSLGIDDPVRFGGSAQESGKGGRGLERSELAGESELVFSKAGWRPARNFPRKTDQHPLTEVSARRHFDVIRKKSRPPVNLYSFSKGRGSQQARLRSSLCIWLPCPSRSAQGF